MSMNQPTLSVFANFYIDNHERLRRMQDSCLSFCDIHSSDWRINIRGRLKHQAADFLRDTLGSRVQVSYLASKKGWAHDSRQVMQHCSSDYILSWVEDHICVAGYEILEEVIIEMKNLGAQQLMYSFWHRNHLEIFEEVEVTVQGNLVNVWEINERFSDRVQESLKRDFYVVSMVSIFQRDLFWRVLNSRRPVIRRWPKHLPHDFEKMYKDGVVKEVRTAIPKYEVFASIDDDHGVPGYSLISRGLYPERVARATMKKEELIKPGTVSITYQSIRKLYRTIRNILSPLF